MRQFKQKGLLAINTRKQPTYRWFIAKGQRSWNAHVRSVYKAYLRKKGIKRRRRLVNKYRRTIRKGRFRLNLRQVKNNFFSTLYTVKRRVLWTFSCGTIGLRGPRRATPFGATQLGRFTSKQIVKTKAFRAYLILKSSFTTHMRGLLRNIGRIARIRALVDLIPRPHNGLRARKMRRI